MKQIRFDHFAPIAGLQSSSFRFAAVGLSVRALLASFASLTAVILIQLTGGSQTAAAQTTPGFVVSSQTQLATPISGAKGNYAVNSRGDFFVQDGNDHVIELPSGGGAPITLWTVPAANTYGASGVAVDYQDNLYITNYFGDQGSNGIDSQVYEFPSTNGSYPAPYIYNPGSPPGICFPFTPVSATNPTAFGPNTGVCAVGSYDGAAFYYWQPLNIAADGQGNTYMYSNYDSDYGSTSLGIFQCDTLCNEQQPGGGATAYTTKLSNSITSMIADYAGDVYFTDQTNVYIIPAGSPRAGNAPKIFDSSYTKPFGVTLDASGNLYVTDSSGIWEVPAVETAGGAPCTGPTDTCQLVSSAKYLIVQSPAATPNSTAAFAAVSPAIDNRGNIVYSTVNSGSYALVKASLWSGTFPATAIGGPSSSALSFTVLFDKATTLGNLTAMQGSAPSTEFAVSPGTCVTGSTFAANTSCTFTATFTPAALGTRAGAILISDNAGHASTTYLSGVGTGTGLTVDPGTPNPVGTGFKKPAGVAVDTQGSVYVADSAANTVTAYPAAGGAAVSIGTGLSVPTGVTVDGAGNVFIVNQGTGNTASVGTGSVVEVPSVGGVLTNSAQTTLIKGLNTPTDIVADGNGNFYVSATGSNQVLQFANASRTSEAAGLTSRGFGLSGPTGLALDASGNVYVADTGNNRVLELGDGFQTAVGNGLTAPTGVAVDPSGSVIIADGTGRILRVPNETSTTPPVGLNQADQQVLGSPLSYPNSLRIDQAGNLYVSDSTAAQVSELQRVTGTVNFGNWNLNTVSDAQSIIVSNIGNTTVTFGNPLFPPPPAGSAFAVQLGSGPTACGGGSFPSGFNCTLSATFSPAVLGAQTYPVVLAAGVANNPTINLTGTGVNEDAATITLTQNAPTGAISYGQPITISAKIAPAGSTPAATGSVVFTFDGQPQRPASLDGTGAASITFNLVNAGTHSVGAYYEGDSNYPELVAASLPLSISLATSTNVLTIVGDSATPLSVAPSHTVTFTDTLTPATVGLFTGRVIFLNTSASPATVLATVQLGSPDPKTGVYTASFVYPAVAGTTLALGSYNIVAQYSGNTNYLPNSSATVSFIVSPPIYTVTASTTSVTSTASNPGTMNLVVTDYSAYEGGVAFSCSGLPANAYCIFRPGSAQLLPAPLITPVAINPVPVALQVQVGQSAAVVEGSFFWVTALALGLVIAWQRRRLRRSVSLFTIVAALCMAGISVLSGCSSSSSSALATPAGTYPITITATSTPLLNGAEPACSYEFCNQPPGPNNPSINVVQTMTFSLIVQ